MINALVYAVYVLRYPVDGFWQLKFTKKDAFRASVVVLIFFCLAIVVRLQLTHFVFNPVHPNDMNLARQVGLVLAGVFLWSSVNWSITTLMDGEGRFQDVWVVTMFSLLPVAILTVPQILFSYVATVDESAFYYGLESLSLVWAALMMVVGLKIVHDYTVLKTLLTMALTIFGMVFTVFIFLMLGGIIRQFIEFAYVVYMEIQFGFR